jgi:hypothetical protein
MVVAVVSLVVALLCVLYVMERPGTIAFGSPSSGGVRVIEADVVGRNSIFSAECWSDHCPDHVIWDNANVTVPEGKKWIVIVTPGQWDYWDYERYGAWYVKFPDVVGTGYYFEYDDSSGNERTPQVLQAGTYDGLDLHIFGCIRRSASSNCSYYTRPLVYLVLEVDE